MQISEIEYYYFNGKWQNSNHFNSSIFKNGTSIYEVIRIIDGIPLFIDEHLDRLVSSFKLSGLKIWFKLEELKYIINNLIKKNDVSAGNIQLLINHSDETGIKNISCRFIPTNYPKEDAYLSGVKSMFFEAVRNDPSIKKTNQSLRKATDIAIKAKQVFEVILVNEHGLISEGSRSNIFFVKNKSIITSANDKVLAGVTRQKIIEICKLNGISILEQSINSVELSNFDAAFFTGTSPKVLPISSIEQFKFNPENSLLKKIMNLYKNEIDSYLELAKRELKK